MLFQGDPGGGSGGFEPTQAQLDAMNSGVTASNWVNTTGNQSISGSKYFNSTPSTYGAITADVHLATKKYVDDQDAKKQDTLIQGQNITLTDNGNGTTTISSTGGAGGSVNIVNNLTTNDPSSALSAAMGYQLNNTIGDIQTLLEAV